MDDHDRTDELRELATFARNKRDLYRARTYSPRETSATRLRELERASEQAEARLKAYIAERSKITRYWDEDGDLDELHNQSGNGKASLKGGNAHRENH